MVVCSRSSSARSRVFALRTASALTALLLTFAVGGTAPGSARASGWSIQPTPNPSAGGTLNAVSCTAPNACTAVGYSGASTLAERWNGTAWTIQPTPTPSGGGQLNAVSCTADTVCMAVGASGSSALAERWNGTAWTIEPTPNPSEGSFLWGMSCSATNACMAVSTSGAVIQWNGNAWTLESFIDPNLYGVSCSGNTSCTAVGFTYVRLCNPFRCWTAVPGDQAAQWNGTNWSASRASGALGKLFAVSCNSSNACVAVGSTGSNTVGEAWNGSSWTTESTPNVPSSENTLAGVSCTSATVCTAVGYAVSVPDYPQATPLAEGLNGTTWTIEPTPNPTGTRSNLLGVSCLTSTACTAVGFSVTSSGADQTLAEQYSG